MTTGVKKTAKTAVSRKTIYKDFETFEKEMNLPDVAITDEEIMKEVKAVRYAKR